MTKQCKCGCFVPTRCHGCGSPLTGVDNPAMEVAPLRAENGNMKLANFINKAAYEAAVRRIGELQTAMSAMQSGELPVPTREHIRRVEAERDTALEAANRYRVALAAMQAMANNRDTGLVDWFVQECGGPWTAITAAMAMIFSWAAGWAVVGAVTVMWR